MLRCCEPGIFCSLYVTQHVILRGLEVLREAEASKQPLEIFQIDTIGKRLASLEQNNNNNNNFREQPSTLYVPQIDLVPKYASVDDALRFIYFITFMCHMEFI